MNRFSLPRLAAGAGLAALMAGTAGAQGADDCASAQVISGAGDWNFLLFTATTDGLPSSACNAFGQDQIEDDVWFLWSPSITGDVEIDTCNTSTVDTRLAVYDAAGGCGSTTPIVCNDDACALQSSVSFTAVSGTQYLIRVGTYPGAAVGGGQIHVREVGSGGNDTCSSAEAIVGEGNFPFDNTSATTDGLADATCEFFGLSQIANDVWFAWTAPDDDSYTITTDGLTSVDTKIAVYDGTSCPTASPLACNDDISGNNFQSVLTFQAFAGSQYLIRLGTYPAPGTPTGTGEFSINADGGGAGGCANPATGADVIVGDLIGVQSYGGLNGSSAFAIGTTSCNVGTQELDWFRDDNRHPVISQNIYRLDNGRFEQVGMGWLKHGFTALQGNVCCTCNPSNSGGSRLGIGCSDPYSASLNGQQPTLGPRSEVNAFTGAFPYPFVEGFNQSGDRLYKRIQVLNSDIDPALRPGALFFGEGHYVTPDDATAGNGFNNASYRPMAVIGAQSGGFAMNMIGSTVRTQPAIVAWKDTDDTVNLQTVVVPGEGAFYVGSNAYDNGDGTWRYEYAIHNLNSDFAGQSFTVQLGANVNVTDIGMSFPDYHSGDPYTNAPWTGTVVGSSVVFETETFATNPDANALRWGTTYSFWFTADTAPEAGTADLGLFKPGGPGPQNVAVKAPEAGVSGPVVSNYCSANANSTGVPASITARDIDLVARTMVLEAVDLPPLQFGLAINSQGTVFVPNLAGGNGNLCVGPQIGRHVTQIQQATAGGVFSIVIDLDAVPTPTTLVGVQPGETWYWQTWFRDVNGLGPTSNLTNGVSVTF